MTSHSRTRFRINRRVLQLHITGRDPRAIATITDTTPEQIEKLLRRAGVEPNRPKRTTNDNKGADLTERTSNTVAVWNHGKDGVARLEPRFLADYPEAAKELIALSEREGEPIELATKERMMYVELAESRPPVVEGDVVKWRREGGHKDGNHGYGQVLEVDGATSTVTVVVLRKVAHSDRLAIDADRRLMTLSFKHIEKVDERLLNEAETIEGRNPQESRPGSGVGALVNMTAMDLSETDLSDIDNEPLPEGEDLKAALLEQNEIGTEEDFSDAESESIVDKFFRLVNRKG